MARHVDAESADINNPLTRTLSMEIIGPTLTSLFRKRKGDDSSNSTPRTGSPHGSDSSDNDQPAKRRKIEEEEKAKAEREAFEAREKELDAELPEEYRKYRPRGFKFNIPPKDRPIRIYADGVFDLFHLGHMRQLEQAKKSFPNVELVCGIPSDKETQKRKGLTVLSDKHRVETLKHCKWVDEVIADAPWCVTTDFLAEHRIDYVAHDDLPYASADSDDIYKPIKEQGKFLTTQRTDGISTSDIITKIIRDYDKYLMRNFARGATRKELNVSWFKKNELEFKKHINDFRTYWVRNRQNFNNVSKDLYVEVREYLRGKKSENGLNSLNSLSANNSSLSLASDTDEVSRAPSPLTEFASKYIVNKNDRPGKSILGNFRDWIGIDDSHDEDSAEESKLSRSSTNSSKKSKKVEVKEQKKEKEQTAPAELQSPVAGRKIRKPKSKKAL